MGVVELKTEDCETATMQAHKIDHVVAKLRTLMPERIAEVEDFIDFLAQRTEIQTAEFKKSQPLNFPVISISNWPKDVSLRREDLYHDEGR